MLLVAMAVLKATAVVTVIIGCLLVGTTNEEPGVTDSPEYVDRKNVTEELADCPPKTRHVGLRFVVVTFNFSRVQTPFIVAAWILFVTLAKIGTVGLKPRPHWRLSPKTATIVTRRSYSRRSPITATSL